MSIKSKHSSRTTCTTDFSLDSHSQWSNPSSRDARSKQSRKANLFTPFSDSELILTKTMRPDQTELFGLCDLNYSNSSEKRKPFDDLVVDDFDLGSTSTYLASNEEEIYTEYTEESASLRTEEPSSSRVLRMQLEGDSVPNFAAHPTSSPKITISEVTQMHLGSTCLPITSELCVRVDYFLLINRNGSSTEGPGPAEFNVAKNEQNKSNSSRHQTPCNSSKSNSTQTILDELNNLRSSPTPSDSGTNSSFKPTKSGDSINLNYKHTSPEKGAISSETNNRPVTPRPSVSGQKILPRTPFRRNRVCPIREISETSGNSSLRSSLSKEERREAQERLEEISRTARRSLHQRPMSRRAWTEETQIRTEDNRHSPMEGKNSSCDILEVIPTEIPDNCALHKPQNEQRSAEPFNNILDFRSGNLVSQRNICSRSLWNTTTEIKVIEAESLNSLADDDQTPLICFPFSWLFRCHKRRKTKKVHPVSKTYFVTLWGDEKKPLTRAKSAVF